MISNLESTTQRDVTHMLTPEEMVEQMRGGYSIGIPLANVLAVSEVLKGLLEEGEVLGYRQSCDLLMDVIIMKDDDC